VRGTPIRDMRPRKTHAREMHAYCRLTPGGPSSRRILDFGFRSSLRLSACRYISWSQRNLRLAQPLPWPNPAAVEIGNRVTVRNIPVNFAIRFSGPVTARHVWHGTGADLICQPGHSSGIKKHSSPPLFQQFSPSIHLPTTPLAPQAAPSSTYSPTRPP
jgi:hypothetical protein